jgi:hypothetical protein
MRTVARVLPVALALASGCAPVEPAHCTDGVKQVSVDEALASLAGETPRQRFERAARAWNCSVTWLELPPAVATQEPAPGTSALALTLERTSDQARYREYARTAGERWDGADCQTDAVFVPCSLELASDDGALDESFACELMLQGDNTYVHLVVPNYDFVGGHALTFAEGIEWEGVELSVVFTPGQEPTRVDGSIVETGSRERGVAPVMTSALIECAAL